VLNRIARLSGGRRAKWVVVGVWVLLLVAMSPLSGKLSTVTEDRIASFLHDDSVALRANDVITERFPGGVTGTAAVVYHRDAGLTEADKETIATEAKAMSAVEDVQDPIVPFTPGVPEGLVSQDGATAFTAVPISADEQKTINDAIANLRDVANGGNGLSAQVTGAAALEADLNQAIESADVALLLVTGAFVLVLLLLIYRSPILALIPLVVVVIAYGVAAGLIKLLADSGLQVTNLSTSLLLVLMFGAGTDYCLLLVARYVEELHTHEDKHDAIAAAVPRVAPAILASAGTVMAALIVLVFAQLDSTKSLGPVDAIGIAIVMAAGLTLLPAILAIVGRRAFWPSKRAVYDPARAAAEPPLEERDTRWRQLGELVTRKPWVTIAAVTAVMLIGAIGLTQYEDEASVIDAFRTDTEGTEGYDTLKAAFPEGALAPATVVVDRLDGPIRDADVAAAQNALKDVPNIGTITDPTGRSTDGRAAVFNVLFPDDPYANPALDRTETMRETLNAALGPDLRTYVGGPSAIQLDYREGAKHDVRLMVPLVLLVVLITLTALLRAVVASAYLIASVILSFFGILGTSVIFYKVVLGEDAYDPNLPLFAFVFLVALGIDYNIFLMDRVREEAKRYGTPRGALRALVATGPVITSAGLILAATFAALAMLPIAVLVELGFAVAFGVLVDTFIIRSMLVPAIISVVGDRSWWPSRLGRQARPTETAPGAPPRQEPV
jgi:RND superfamily putative drug exporter